MIENFEEITADLTDQEKSVLSLVIASFKNRTEDNPIKSAEAVKSLNAYFDRHEIDLKMTGVRLRKMVNYIRINSILPIIATSKGYYVSYDLVKVYSQIVSLRQRARSIDKCADGMMKFLNPE